MAKGPDLPTLPALEADPGEHLRFVNQALRRKWNHIVRVRKYGNTAPALVLVFENRDELRLPASQHKYGAGLRNAMHSYDGIVCPAYTKPQLEIVFAGLIKAADLYERDDELETLTTDLNVFLRRCLLKNDRHPLYRPEPDEDADGELYRAIVDFQLVNDGRSGHPAEPPPVLLFWRLEPLRERDPEWEMWIPRGALATYLRALRWVVGGHLRGLLFSLGFEARTPEARSKADWRRKEKANVWAITLPWELGEIDLALLVAMHEKGEKIDNHVPTSLDVPLRSNAREGTPRAHTYRGRDVAGRGDVHENGAFFDGRPRRGENRGL